MPRNQSRNDFAKKEKGRAYDYHPTTKELPNKFELKSIFQRKTFNSIRQNDITALIGLAGSAKTLLSIYTAVRLLNNPESTISKIYIVRLAQETMGESIGALPGFLEEKLEFMIGPIIDNMSLFCTPTQIKKYLEDDLLEVIPVSHLRGRSLANSFVLVEECQNLDENMILTILTRIGLGSKLVFTGDPAQTDFNGRNGTVFLSNMLTDIPGCEVVTMPSTEIYRHPVIKNLLKRAQDLSVKNITI